MDNEILKKEDGQVTTIEYTDELAKKLKETNHICWDCVNANSDRCSKVHDIVKKDISAYNYITDGYQIIDGNNMVDTFIVTKCNNFKKDAVVKKNNKDKERLKRIKEGLLMYYFDAKTPEEAYLIQDKQINSKSDTNKIINVHGKRPLPYQLEEMRRKK